MSFKHHTHPDQLEKYSFWWSEVRLVIAAVALLLGGVPPIFLLNPIPSLVGTISALLQIAWIISGVVSVYLLYRWNAVGHKLFGAKVPLDRYAFLVNVVSGLNLGLTGLLHKNIGMSIAYGPLVFLILALIYLVYEVEEIWKKNVLT
jgi:uncharacterized membrane protein YuzA (DUF378 family)